MIIKYCKECNTLLRKWYVSETVYQSTRMYMDENGFEDYGESDTHDSETNGWHCLECNSDIEEKDLRDESAIAILKYMTENKLDAIKIDDVNILGFLL